MTRELADRQLVEQITAGDSAALGALMARHRDRLARMVRLRLDRRMQGRISPSDVLQESFLEAARRIKEYLDQPDVPFYVWLRFLTGQRLAWLHRHHLGTQARDAGREVSLYQMPIPAVTSAVLAARLIGRLSSPSIAAQRAELRNRLEEALNAMDPFDREAIALRHFEQLSNTEVATILELSPSAASMRYIRAIEKLRNILSLPDL